LFPDISEWYTPERIDSEEPLWGASKSYLIAVREVMGVCDPYGLTNVVEVGCGTAWIPTALPRHITYVGIDKNPHMLRRARVKNPDTVFIEWDIRELSKLNLTTDLVFSLGVLKHFSLDEWADRLKDILALGKYGLFTQHIFLNDARKPIDDGKEYHHIWVTESQMIEAVDRAGHEIIWRDDTRLDTGVGFPESSIATKRKDI